ncbi:MAG: proline--tRNA ligase [Phycisphaerae bacterium]|nr:proline--tRNA ligase [Phycisphaerae bacterium]
MRWTRYLIPTTKEVPKDATVPSHQLMIRTGLIRQLAAGVYTYLPLGYRSLRKIEAIVREEMNRAGAIELHMPCLQPLDLWDESGRTQVMGDVLLRLAGPKGDWRTQTCLGPTHEENVTEIARAFVNSYKQLPINLYQIQTKFRGEARPKSGVLRTREFLMKDAYSFDRDKAGLDLSYQKMYDAYCRIYERCGLPYLVVEAESGPIGGDASHEFMVLTDAGEDIVAVSESGDYAANTERAIAAPIAPSDDPMQPLEEVHTPSQRTIDEVCAFLKTRPGQMIKTLIYLRPAPSAPDSHAPARAAAPANPSPVVVLIRGDHEVNEHKLKKAAGGPLELAGEGVIQNLTGADVGFAGPHGLVERGARLIIDPAVVAMRNACTGANKTGYHVRNLNPGRDFPTSGDNVVVADVRNVVDGDASPTGSGSPLRLRTAIEVGHVFKLGTKYSDALKAHFLDQDGKSKPFIMGCYGIGLNRIMAAAIEAHHDENGIIWPASIAPFEVLIVALDPREADVMSTAETLHDELEAAGVDVLFDDRDERAGFKFKDADLIGIPLRITVGRKSLADGVVELKRRDSSDVTKLAPTAVKSHVLQVMHT